MQLLVQLISGSEPVTLDASLEELVGEVQERAAAALQKPRVSLVRAAALAPLSPSSTVQEAGLVDGEQLTAVATCRDFPTLDIVLPDNVQEDSEMVRQAVASVQGPYNVRLVTRTTSPREVPPDLLNLNVWPELWGAVGLEVAWDDNVTQGLQQLKNLKHVDFELGDMSDASFSDLMQSLPEGLEDLRLYFRTLPPPAAVEILGTGFRRLTCLRAAYMQGDIFEADDGEEVQTRFLQALPVGLQEVGLQLPWNPESLQQTLPQMPFLKVARFSSEQDDENDISLPRLLRSLPAGLLELHLDMLDRFAANGHCDVEQMRSSFQHLTRLRVLACPHGRAAAGLLATMPDSVEDLRLWWPRDVKTLEHMQDGLHRVQRLEKLRWVSVRVLTCNEGRDAVAIWDRVLDALPCCIEGLNLSHCELSSEVAEALAGHLGRFLRLKTLNLGGNRRLGEPALVAILGALPETVGSIVLDPYPLDDATIVALRDKLPAPQLATLRRITVSFETLDAGARQNLTEEHLKRLLG